MTRIELAIDGDVCGPMSIGTVAVIRALAKHLALTIAEAATLVDRCVFEGARLAVDAPSRDAAEALLAEFQQLPARSRIHASIAD
ncbi:MAG TPA: hypothetical protein VER96_21470 [Polyangiaceae bacterium]|nr:hypothetical protein [Polyangiaceae bacterium]